MALGEQWSVWLMLVLQGSGDCCDPLQLQRKCHQEAVHAGWTCQKLDVLSVYQQGSCQATSRGHVM